MRNLLSKEARFNTIASHYKDTFDIHLLTIKDRNKLFFYLLIILAVFVIQFKDSSFVQQVCTELLKKNIGTIDEFSKFIPVLIWFLLMGISLRYFQINVQIERQYAYLHALENELNGYFIDSVAFTREGKSYLSNYPTFFNWFSILYTWIFPLSLLILIILRIYTDLNSWPPNFSNISCFIAYEITGTTTILYIIKMHLKKPIKVRGLNLKH